MHTQHTNSMRMLCTRVIQLVFLSENYSLQRDKPSHKMLKTLNDLKQINRMLRADSEEEEEEEEIKNSESQQSRHSSE